MTSAVLAGSSCLMIDAANTMTTPGRRPTTSMVRKMRFECLSGLPEALETAPQRGGGLETPRPYGRAEWACASLANRADDVDIRDTARRPHVDKTAASCPPNELAL